MQGFSTMQGWTIANRVAITFVGVFSGLVTIIPNALGGSDNPKHDVEFAVNLGLTASLALMVGGVSGCWLDSWLVLLPGAILQALTMLMW